MRLKYFKIENFRNIALAECDNVPNLMVICGGNGCGKSALLNAIMAAKEHAAPYGGFNMDPGCVSSDAEVARVTLRLEFSEIERTWYQEKYADQCPETDEIILEIQRGGQAKVPKRSQVAKNLLSWYSREYKASPGFFDYIDAHRITQKRSLSTWDSSSLSDAKYKQSLGAVGTQKFQLIKEYLASLVMSDAQAMLAAKRKGEECCPDSLKKIREFFDKFFSPMKFVDVRIDCSPFRFIISTPKGEIDIDDLSSGEKEILNTYIHFHQLNPKDAVILFDEVDAHLHPDLERRYLFLFKEMAETNQIILTTHSPEIMVAAGSDFLFTLDKIQHEAGFNQLRRVTDSDELHGALSEIMGSNGMVSINRKVVFIEGVEASADRYIYESFYPPAKHNVSFIPVGNSSINRSTAERVNELLTAHGTFQEFYSIVDADITRAGETEVPGRLFKLPVYHVENFLIETELIYALCSELLLDQSPYGSSQEIEKKLRELLFLDSHLLPFTRAVLDARVANIAKKAWDSVYQRDTGGLSGLSVPTFDEAKTQAREVLERSVENNEWLSICKGRDLLKSFCMVHQFKYEHFRNMLIARLPAPPPRLSAIFDRILGVTDRA